MTTKRDLLLNLIHSKANPEYVPAAFFMHFDDSHHQGSAAIDKHMEYFRYTGMDFVKIQYEQSLPVSTTIRKPEDWKQIQPVQEQFFEPSFRVAEGMVKEVHGEALVIMTLYSPLMQAIRLAGAPTFSNHLYENPDAVLKGLAIMTENVLRLVRGCKRAGVDGFYVSTQGGETSRFKDKSIFKKYIKPTDLAVWDEVQSCRFNILHVCDYIDRYDDLTPFLDYPGHVVNSSLRLGDGIMSAKDISQMFRRPFMGGLERKGVMASGERAVIQQAVTNLLAQAPDGFILGADCTVPSETSWDNLKIAIETAHYYKK